MGERELAAAAARLMTTRLAATLAGTALFLCSACDTRPPRKTDETSEATALFGAALPAGATAVRTNAEAGLDRLALLRFDAPAGEADAWIRRVAGGPAVAGNDPGLGYLGKTKDWWIATFPAGAAGVEAQRDGRVTRVVTAPAGAGRQRVWAAAFSH